MWALLACAAPTVLAAQNLVVNPGFDTTLDGWDLVQGLPSWSSEDASGSPASGSVELRNDSLENGSLLVLGQCIPVEADTGYKVGGAFMNLPDQATSGYVGFFVYIYENGGCTGSPIAATAGSLSKIGTWGTRYSQLHVPASESALSAHFRLVVTKDDAGVDYTARADDILLTPDIFYDGFESGLLSSWSSYVP